MARFKITSVKVDDDKGLIIDGNLFGSGNNLLSREHIILNWSQVRGKDDAALLQIIADMVKGKVPLEEIGRTTSYQSLQGKDVQV